MQPYAAHKAEIFFVALGGLLGFLPAGEVCCHLDRDILLMVQKSGDHHLGCF